METKIKKGLVIFLLYGLSVSILSFGIRSVTRGNTLGADFFIYYWAGRAAFAEGISPYDTRLVLETQQAITGQAAQPGQDQMAFAYPAYALFLIFPLVWLDFPTAQAIWMSANLMLIILLPILLLPRIPPITVLTFPLFYPLTFGVLLGNFNIPTAVAILVFLVLLVIRKERAAPHQILAGVLLAWTLSKPQLAWLFLIFAAIFLFRERLRIALASFAASALLLLGFSFLVFPIDWPLQWLSRAQSYSGYVQAESVINSFSKVFLPTQVALFLTVVIIIILGAITVSIFANWWAQTSHAARLPAFVEKALQNDLWIPVNDLQILAWIGFLTYLVHPSHTSYEQVSVMIPFFLWTAANWRVVKRAPQFFWIAGLVVSWLALIIDLLKWSPVGIYALPVLFYALWILYVFKPTPLPVLQRMPHAPA